MTDEGGPHGGSPWTSDDLLRWGATVALGATVSGAGWFFAAGRGHVADQIIFANMGVAGLMIGAYAHLAWMFRGRRTVGARMQHLLGPPPAPGTATGTGARWVSEVLVAGPELRLFHRADCPLAAGSGWSPELRSKLEATGRHPCGVCRP